MVNLDKPNADLAKGDFFAITGWCRDLEYVKPAGVNPMMQIGTPVSMVHCPATDEGARKNTSGMSCLYEVVAADYPQIMVRMHELRADPWAGQGYPMVLDARDFECRRPSADYVATFLAASAGMRGKSEETPKKRQRPRFWRWLRKLAR